MCSVDAFEVMIAFLDVVKDIDLQYQLNKILQRKSPFANFKWEVEYSEYRQKWFDFRKEKYMDYTMNILTLEGIDFEK